MSAKRTSKTPSSTAVVRGDTNCLNSTNNVDTRCHDEFKDKLPAGGQRLADYETGRILGVKRHIKTEAKAL